MMYTEKELINKIKKLNQIKPKKDWVFLTKKEILGEIKPSFSFFPFLKQSLKQEPELRLGSYLKPAFAGFTVVLVIFGILGFANKSVPGEPFYALKKAAHWGQMILASEAEKPTVQLQLANDRLQDLTKASPENLAPTINEFQANIAEAAKELTKMNMTTSTPATIQKIVNETKKLQENKQKVESLGVVIDGTQELDDALAKITASLISDLETRTLNEKDSETLTKIKELFDQQKYSEVLELYLTSK